jgi:hypothetical protein
MEKVYVLVHISLEANLEKRLQGKHLIWEKWWETDIGKEKDN